MRGIRNLHAKMYLFGESTAVVTSANLTDAGLDRNPELGIVTQDPAAIARCTDYFNALWRRGEILRPEQAGDWAATVKAHQASGGRRKEFPTLGDFGADIGLTPPPAIPPDLPFAEGEQAFVKFLGRNDNRAHPSWTAFEELERAGCHWAVAYPAGRRPRIVGTAMRCTLRASPTNRTPASSAEPSPSRTGPTAMTPPTRKSLADLGRATGATTSASTMLNSSMAAWATGSRSVS